MTLLSVSFYHALATKQFPLTNGMMMKFDPADYIRILGENGITRTRMFIELPWYAESRDPKIDRWKPQNTILPYVWTGKTWDFDQVNPEYTDRVEATAKMARKYGIEILLCFVTQGLDFNNNLKFPFFAHMGYNTAKEYYYLADDPRPTNGVLRWKRFQKYFYDVAKMTARRKGIFKLFEPYNEYRQWGGLVDEHDAIRKAVSSARSGYRMQLNMPNPAYEEILDGGRWIRRLQKKYNCRFSHHGIFEPKDVRDTVAAHKGLQLNHSTLELSTDGATPWRLASGKYRFSYNDHQGHYNYRIDWNKNAGNQAQVTAAHVEILRECQKQGVGVFDVQDMCKWSRDISYDSKSNQQFYQALVKG